LKNGAFVKKKAHPFYYSIIDWANDDKGFFYVLFLRFGVCITIYVSIKDDFFCCWVFF